MSARPAVAIFLCFAVLVACDTGFAPVPVPNPVPWIQSMEVDAGQENQEEFHLLLRGTGFVDGATVFWDETLLPTNFESPGRVIAEINLANSELIGPGMVRVVNPPPGGGSSDAVEYAVHFPAPRVDSLSPSSAPAQSDETIRLSVHGSGFVSGARASRVLWGEEDIPTEFVSPEKLVAEVWGVRLREGKSVPVRVQNESPGGGTSAPREFDILNPVPIVQDISPEAVRVGTPGALKVVGRNFLHDTYAVFAGDRLDVSVESDTSLVLTYPGEPNSRGGTVRLELVNPSPGGGSSDPVELPVWEPPPVVDSVSPSFVFADEPSLTVEVYGSDFWPEATVRWNGATHAASVIHDELIEIPVEASEIRSPSVVDITISNPTEGGTTTTTWQVREQPSPSIEEISPSWVSVGNGEFVLTIRGADFLHEVGVTWNGHDISSSVVSDELIEVRVPASYLEEGEIVDVVVKNSLAEQPDSGEFRIVPPPPMDAPVVIISGDGSGIQRTRLNGSPRDTIRVAHPSGVDASPRGEKLVYVSPDRRTVPAGPDRVYMVDPSDGRVVRITPEEEGQYFREFRPRFSADGRFVYFTREYYDYVYEIVPWRVDLTTGIAEQVASAFATHLRYVDPSHQGSRVAYSALSRGHADRRFHPGSLVVHDLEEDKSRSIAADAIAPAWAPDDRWIAYTTGSSLRLLRPDGSEGHEVFSGSVGLELEWSPDGQFLVVIDAGGQAFLITVANGDVTPLEGLGVISSMSWIQP